MAGLVLFFLALSLAAFFDMKSRNIPDWLPCLAVAASLIAPGHPSIAGTAACLPLFITGITAGGIGGGDIKLTAACGAVLGFCRTMAGLLAALCLLLVWHGLRMAAAKIRKKEIKSGKEQAYPLAPFLWAGMLFSILLF